MPWQRVAAAIAFLIALGLLLNLALSRAWRTSPAAPAPTEVAEVDILASVAAVAPSPAPTTAPAAPTEAQAPTPGPTSAGVAPTRDGCPAEAPIKGNIVGRGDNDGERIYHIPGGASYDRTKPERCFPTEEAAQQAGFRKAER